ncbi:MAG: 1-acyl-sn-glycerol-3-phosphate acyltransferase [Chloroflexi bacterium]|nr:1-acyl-sn-glycerol-3-phosphate acyltransferase [Chloroflexota bacterium]
MFPRYSFPPRNVAGLIVDMALTRRRSFREDARACVGRLTPQGRSAEPSLHGIGEENIPQRGPCVVTFNHYHRPNFNAIWMAVAIAATIPVEMHFVMTGELTYPGKWYAPLGMFFTKIVLRRIARVYGFTTMPPMPPRAKDVESRAQSVRRVLEVARREKNVIIGLAPEGGDNPTGEITMPASGAGRFALLLAAAGVKFVPVGIYEANGALCLNFGAAYELTVPHNLSADEKDRAAAHIVMSRIAALLPESLRGKFKEKESESSTFEQSS